MAVDIETVEHRPKAIEGNEGNEDDRSTTAHDVRWRLARVGGQ